MRLLNDSTQGFCQGAPGSMNVIVVFSFSVRSLAQSARALLISHPRTGTSRLLIAAALA